MKFVNRSNRYVWTEQLVCHSQTNGHQKRSHWKRLIKNLRSSNIFAPYFFLLLYNMNISSIPGCWPVAKAYLIMFVNVGSRQLFLTYNLLHPSCIFYLSNNCFYSTFYWKNLFAINAQAPGGYTVSITSGYCLSLSIPLIVQQQQHCCRRRGRSEGKDVWG